MKIKTVLLLALLFSMTTRAQTVIDLPVLKATFNYLQGYTRVIFLGDPTCPGCIASANELRNNLFNQCNNPDLCGLIVWIHVSGFSSTLTDAITQSTPWTDPRVACYWDSLWDISYAFGYQGGWAGCNWAWDIAMIYPDTATWPGNYPLAPYYCMSKTGCCNGWNVPVFRNQLTALGECASTAIDESASADFSFTIFPNPFSNQAAITFSKEINTATFRLYNLYGQLVQEKNNISGKEIILTRENLRSGVYVYEVVEERGIIAIGKVIVD